ncbi:MAG: hypothetical protein RBR69_01950 [Candidatus Cloacimonadaceae bacterium]|jgi:tRNA nucleotidyltransferase/poly(A) polymerase|nr:hypothetical protein [Candidatus Cloacimonadota bacterium]MCK9178843.1 hypothetical protein [Candidatus Cloacimonadota bacterium]MDD3104307.1 hypothetical protein [Candidatus Cloacimonadota bacterium]MDD3533655.1 hypothetical protein [Candidatus Cloacimonadota bacterium]MDY0126888.1 hypothetical protein [Candidatus Cloacimonadaceae bacterium]
MVKDISMGLEELRCYLRDAMRDTIYSGRVYFAGGCVRDHLLVKNCSDVDICVLLEDGGLRLAQYLAGVWGVANPVVYGSYNAAMLKYNGMKLEIITAVTDFHQNKTKPSGNIPSGLRDDILRRDFTVNALLMSVETGEILDLCERGKADIQNRLIRCVGEPTQTLRDDPLRIMRAVRLSIQLGFRIEGRTQAALSELVTMLDTLPYKRIAAELNKILEVKDISYGLDILLKSGILKQILPELFSPTEGFTSEYHKLGIQRLLELVANYEPRLYLRWALLLSGIAPGKEIGGSIHLQHKVLRRFQIPIAAARDIIWALGNIDALRHTQLPLSDVDIILLRRLAMTKPQRLELLTALLKADDEAHEHTEGWLFHVTNKLEYYRRELRDHPFPLSGNDLITAFSLRKGVLVGKLLHEAWDIWLHDPQISQSDLIKGIEIRFRKELDK